MSASSSSPNPNSFINRKILRLDFNGKLCCYHDIPAVKRTAGADTSRPGQQFFGCGLWPDVNCSFFVWKHKVDNALNYGESMRNEALQLKLSRSEFEKLKLQEEIKGLKTEMEKSKTAMRKYLIVMVFVLGVVWLWH